MEASPPERLTDPPGSGQFRDVRQMLKTAQDPALETGGVGKSAGEPDEGAVTARPRRGHRAGPCLRAMPGHSSAHDARLIAAAKPSTATAVSANAGITTAICLTSFIVPLRGFSDAAATSVDRWPTNDAVGALRGTTWT